MTDLDFTADRSTWYQAGLATLVRGERPVSQRRVSMRVANNEEVEVAIHTDPRKITLEDLGVTEDDLAQMDERQNTADSVRIRRQKLVLPV